MTLGENPPENNDVTADAILTEAGLDYYGQKLFEIIKRNITPNTINILGDCGHAGRYGLNIARDIPHTRVTLCEVKRNNNPSKINTANSVKINAASMGLKNVTTAKSVGSPFAAGALRFDDGAFDMVFSFELENFVDYKKLLAEYIRVLKPGGTLLIGVPNSYNIFHTLRKKMLQNKGIALEYGYEKSFSPYELVALFHDNKLTDRTLSGAGVMQSLMRLSKVSKYKNFLNAIKWWSLCRIFDMTVIRLVDFFTIGFFSTLFGFEIVATGIKQKKNE